MSLDKTSESLEKTSEKVTLLEHGFVQLLDVMGTDESIAATARVSVRTAQSRSSDRALLRTLIRDQHSSPTEFGEMIFHLKMPIFIARQIVRHRTASISEVSGRYGEIPDEIFVPGENDWRGQGTLNRQMSGDYLPASVGEDCTSIASRISEKSYAAYRKLLDEGVSREMARTVLPVGTFTEWRWKCDVHNLLNFLRLRLAPDAQYEVRIYAIEMARIFAKHFPIIWEAFNDYTLKTVQFTHYEILMLRRYSMMELSDLSTRPQRPESISIREWETFINKVNLCIGVIDFPDVLGSTQLTDQNG